MPSPTIDALSAQLEAIAIKNDSGDVDELVSETTHVYMRYSTSEPPAHPGKGWTRFVCISDTHGSTPFVPYGDVLIHAGDLSTYGRRKSWLTSMKFLRDLPHPIKLVIAGNHDRLLDPEMYPESAEELELLSTAREALCGPDALKRGIRYMQYQSTTLDKENGPWEVYGSPSWEGGSFAYGNQGTPYYSAGAFQYEEHVAEDINALIPSNTQILITHGPPYGILDRTRRGKKAGCPDLAHRLFAPTPSATSRHSKQSSSPPSATSWLPAVRLHVFGHIHESWGAKIITRSPPPSDIRGAYSTSTPTPPSSTQSSPSSRGSRRRQRQRRSEDAPDTNHCDTPRDRDQYCKAPQAIETVFVNAAVQNVGAQAIIVDLKNPPADSEPPADS